MNCYLFTLAVAVQERPERWGSVSGYYLNLAHSLQRMGHEVIFALNPQIRLRKEFFRFEHHAVPDHAALQDLLQGRRITHAFIWGGASDGGS